MNWARLAGVRTAVLVLTAFALLSIAAFLAHLLAGLVVTALLLLTLDYCIPKTPKPVTRA